MYYLSEIKKSLATALDALGVGEKDVEIKIDIPSVSDHGDVSTPIAMFLAKKLKKSPIETANNIKNNLPGLDFVKKVEVVEPGYLNFFLSKDVFSKRILNDVLSDKNELVHKSNIKTKVIVEHTSVNPNKAMHVGHIRNAIIGDCLSRLYKKLDYTVEVHNYIDDTGIQIADTTTAMLYLQKEQPEGQDFDIFCWDINAEINKKYETDTKLLKKRKEVVQKIEQGNNETAKKAKEITDKVVQCHLESLADFNIYYDLLVYESDIIKFGFWEEAFKKLRKSPNFVYKSVGKQKGCWVLKYEDNKFEDKIFVRSDGTKVYIAKDTAYHMWKLGLLNKDFLYKKWELGNSKIQVWKTELDGEAKSSFGKGNVVVNVIDERQRYPQEMVKYALKSLGYKKEFDNYEHVAYGVVNLSIDTAKELGIDTSNSKGAYAMAGRKGVGVKVKDILNLLFSKIKSEMNKNNLHDEDILKIAVGALKFYMLKSHPSSEIIFDYKQALQLTGNTGPYLQYSFTRVYSLLNKAGNFPSLVSKKQNLNDREFELIKQISLWPNIQKDTFENKNLSILAGYAYSLSATFHRFYESNDILHSPDNVKNFRLTLALAYKQVIRDVLNTVGIQTLERM